MWTTCRGPVIKAEDGEHLEVPRELALVAEAGEGNVGLLAGGGASVVHGVCVCALMSGIDGWL